MAKTYNSIEEFNTELQTALSGLNEEIGSFIKPISQDLASDIKERVKGTGVSGTDKAFTTPYSKRHEKRKIKEGKSPFGKRVDIRNFYFKGVMWDSFDFKMAIVDSNAVNSVIAFGNYNAYMSNDELAEWHSEKEKMGIANPNKAEEQKVVEAIGVIVGNYLQRILG